MSVFTSLEQDKEKRVDLPLKSLKNRSMKDLYTILFVLVMISPPTTQS